MEANYKRVMSTTFVKEYEKCPVIITAEYFKDGYPQNYMRPPKLKKMYFFQCVNIGDSGTAMPVTNEIAGDYFVIDKTQAEDEILLGYQHSHNTYYFLRQKI